MIKHIVMWNVRGETPRQKHEAVALIRQQFESLLGRIPGLRHLEIGADVSAVSHACDVVLYSEFDSHESLRRYATHPEHVRVREALSDLRTARFQVDYEPAAGPGSGSEEVRP